MFSVEIITTSRFPTRIFNVLSTAVDRFSYHKQAAYVNQLSISAFKTIPSRSLFMARHLSALLTCNTFHCPRASRTRIFYGKIPLKLLCLLYYFLIHPKHPYRVDSCTETAAHSQSADTRADHRSWPRSTARWQTSGTGARPVRGQPAPEPPRPLSPS